MDRKLLCVSIFVFICLYICSCWVLAWSSAEAAWVSDPVLSSCPLVEVGPTWARLGGNSPQSTSGQSRTGTTFPLHPRTKKIQSRTFALSLWVVGLAHSSVREPRAWGTTWVPKSDFVEPEIEKGLDLVDGQVGGAGQAARQANAGRDRRSQRKVRPGWLRFCLRRPGCSGSCLLLSLSLFTCFFLQFLAL